MNKPSGVRADEGRSHRELEAIAHYVRKELNLGPTEAIDPLLLFEHLHNISLTDAAGKTIPFRYHVMELEGSEGFARYDAEICCIEIVASAKTYEWLEDRNPRAGFFVAHELAHCLLHTNQLVRLAKMPTNQQKQFHRGLTAHPTYQDTEWQANAFAGALLMPARGLVELNARHGSLTAHNVQDTFKVSGVAAGIRLEIFRSRRHELLSI